MAAAGRRPQDRRRHRRASGPSSASCSRPASPASPFPRNTAAEGLTPGPRAGVQRGSPGLRDCPTWASPAARPSACAPAPCWPTPPRSSCAATSRGSSPATSCGCSSSPSPRPAPTWPGSDPGRPRRRPLDPQRLQDLEQRRLLRRLRHVSGPDQLGRPQAPRPDLVRGADRRAGSDHPADHARSTATPSSVKSSSTTSSCPTRTSSARSTRVGGSPRRCSCSSAGGGGSTPPDPARHPGPGARPGRPGPQGRPRTRIPLVRQLIARAHINDYAQHQLGRPHRVPAALATGHGCRVSPPTGSWPPARCRPSGARIGMQIGGPDALLWDQGERRSHDALAQLPQRPGHVHRRRHQRDAAQRHRRAGARSASGAELRHQQALSEVIRDARNWSGQVG